MSYGKKCSTIFMRKVQKRLETLEERYKGLTPKKRASKINEELMDNFCVGLDQTIKWKRVIETANFIRDVSDEIEPEKISQSVLYEVSRVPKEKQVKLAKKAVKNKLTRKQTKALVDKELNLEREPKGPYVSKSGVEWTDYGLNIYLGCGHNCEYCYAKTMNQKTRWVEEWSKSRKREINLEELSKELDELPKGSLFFCSITDAYQPLNRKLNWASEVLKILLSKRHIQTLILTKSADVEKDFDDIFYASNEYHNVKVGFTITCLDDGENRKFEPYSSPPTERVRVLQMAHKLGIPTFASIEPWILGHTEPIEIIKRLQGIVDEWIIGVYNHNPEVKLEHYQPFIGELHNFLISNHIKFRMKAELDRAFKSNPVLSKKHYLEAERQMVA